MAEISVNWMARNLGSPNNVGFGNHHYILILTDGLCLTHSFPIQNHNGHEFFTLGAFSVTGNMVFEPNNISDVSSARDCLDATPIKDFFNPFDWGTQKHVVPPPSGNPTHFAVEAVKLAENYKRNTGVTPLPYTITDDNCASWVNTLFKVAGITEAQRKALGQFWGIDWAEQLEIPEDLFK